MFDYIDSLPITFPFNQIYGFVETAPATILVLSTQDNRCGFFYIRSESVFGYSSNILTPQIATDNINHR